VGPKFDRFNEYGSLNTLTNSWGEPGAYPGWLWFATPRRCKVIGMIAVASVLAVGIYSLFRGGDFGRSYSNKLMRLRVVMQAIAIAVLMGAVWWRTRH
jgi:hypothetical protein